MKVTLIQEKAIHLSVLEGTFHNAQTPKVLFMNKVNQQPTLSLYYTI